MHEDFIPYAYKRLIAHQRCSYQGRSPVYVDPPQYGVLPPGDSLLDRLLKWCRHVTVDEQLRSTIALAYREYRRSQGQAPLYLRLSPMTALSIDPYLDSWLADVTIAQYEGCEMIVVDRWFLPGDEVTDQDGKHPELTLLISEHPDFEEYDFQMYPD